jgi:toxin ParE1/3/4
MDVESILGQSQRMFGPRQRHAYAGIIGDAVDMVASDPLRPGSRNRDELSPDVRSFHLELAAGRRGGASHCLYFMTGTLDDGTDGIIIPRVLHERMEPKRHVADAD